MLGDAKRAPLLVALLPGQILSSCFICVCGVHHRRRLSLPNIKQSIEFAFVNGNLRTCNNNNNLFGSVLYEVRYVPHIPSECRRSFNRQ